MLLIPNHGNRLDRLAGKLRLAEAPTHDLVAEIISVACTRMPSLNKSSAAAVQFDKLKKTSAWMDLAIALIELELPAWKLRRLVPEDGAWFCSLSKQCNVPLAVDDTVDASHEDLPLAILSAFVEACKRNAAREIDAQTVPLVRPSQGYAVCCDNFA
jgi:hypothetical protein